MPLAMFLGGLLGIFSAGVISAYREDGDDNGVDPRIIISLIVWILSVGLTIIGLALIQAPASTEGIKKAIFFGGLFLGTAGAVMMCVRADGRLAVDLGSVQDRLVNGVFTVFVTLGFGAAAYAVLT